MHEVSVAEGLLDAATRECIRQGYSTIGTVRVRIGRASGVMPEALLFAFDALKDETPAKEATLEIEIVPVGGFCNDCRKDFIADDLFVFQCPLCLGGSFVIRSGRELDISEMEVS